jgi:hypothetical protein
MNMFKMTLISAALVALTGCIIAPAPGYDGGPAYYDRPEYHAAPAYGGGAYFGGFDVQGQRWGGQGGGDRGREEFHR